MVKGNVEVKVKVRLSLWSIFKMFLLKFTTIVPKGEYIKIKKPRKDEIILFKCPTLNAFQLKEFREKVLKGMKEDPILVTNAGIEIIKANRKDIYVDTKSNRRSK